MCSSAAKIEAKGAEHRYGDDVEYILIGVLCAIRTKIMLLTYVFERGAVVSCTDTSL